MGWTPSCLPEEDILIGVLLGKKRLEEFGRSVIVQYLP